MGKGCDLILGVASVLMDKGHLRKELYGKAGAVRFKPFGIEYRVLSNFWTLDPKKIEWVYDGVDRVLEMVSAGVDFDESKDAIISAINNNDAALAESLVKRYNIKLV